MHCHDSVCDFRKEATNTPYMGPGLANQNSRKLGVFDWKLEKEMSYSVYFDEYKRKCSNNGEIKFSLIDNFDRYQRLYCTILKQ